MNFFRAIAENRLVDHKNRIEGIIKILNIII
jgi:hypothetical protein